MALALKIPAVGISTLEVMAAEALSRFPDARWAIAVADAKRGEIYLAASAPSRELLISPRLLPAEQVGSALSATAERFGLAPVLAGTAAPIVREQLMGLRYSPVDSEVRQPSAAVVGLLCEHLPVADSARPLYLRPPDAKLPRAP
jgi:tRNA A37 threonylcarbamoyladenosine modification protein TsaB